MRAGSTFSPFSVILPVLIFFSTPAYAATKVCASDPFADPSSDPCDVLGYIASNALTTVAIILIGLVLLAHVAQTIKFGGWWLWVLFVGEAVFIGGFACRYGLHKNPQNDDIFKAEYLLIILAPNAFVAADYMILSRIATHIDVPHLLPIRPSRVTLTFVASDIITFLVQAAGAAIAVSAKPTDNAKKLRGDHIFIAGLALQLVSFGIYAVCILLFLHRVYKKERRIWTRDSLGSVWSDWRTLACALSFNCICIIERCIYRLIEINDGFRGPIATSETLFYCCDSLVLFLALAVFVPFWPGRIIRPKQTQDRDYSMPLDSVKGQDV
ncbi:RTA1-domain-containing protein [Peniophora sp. CONT]|nr:RTA1-domain-containing protein [Peniophora sp. CONT]